MFDDAKHRATWWRSAGAKRRNLFSHGPPKQGGGARRPSTHKHKHIYTYMATNRKNNCKQNTNTQIDNQPVLADRNNASSRNMNERRPSIEQCLSIGRRSGWTPTSAVMVKWPPPHQRCLSIWQQRLVVRYAEKSREQDTLMTRQLQQLNWVLCFVRERGAGNYAVAGASR